MMQLNLMRRMLTLGVILLAICSEVAYGGSMVQHTVQGTVKDAQTSLPVEGVSVSVKGSAIAATTDSQGKFNIAAVNPGAVLVFTAVGYKRQEAAAGTGQLQIWLEPSETALDEVIIVGYGTQRKSDLTGAVAVVGAKEITQRPVDRVEQGLQGRIAGVQVTSTTGAPAGGMRIRIRGSNSIQYGNNPLYVIDGFPMGGSSE